ncbi:MAG: oxidoreductase, partial [Rhizobiaceae bacterium]|nr:oxidoreductase [Rhizobiaceae bacterium]
GHRYSPIIFDDPNYHRRDYHRFGAYGQSKTANILFALALDARGARQGVRAFSLHPGAIVSTDLKREFSAEELRQAGVLDEKGEAIIDPSRALKTVEQGAATQVWCAVSPQLDGMGGVYCENVEVARPVREEDIREWSLGDSTQTVGVMPYAIDPDTADRLWTLSEELLGLEACR